MIKNHYSSYMKQVENWLQLSNTDKQNLIFLINQACSAISHPSMGFLYIKECDDNIALAERNDIYALTYLLNKLKLIADNRWQYFFNINKPFPHVIVNKNNEELELEFYVETISQEEFDWAQTLITIIGISQEY